VQEGGRERAREWVKRRQRSSVEGMRNLARAETTIGVETNTRVFLETDINRTNKLSIKTWRFGCFGNSSTNLRPYFYSCATLL
jgi:hypothetical protein